MKKGIFVLICAYVLAFAQISALAQSELATPKTETVYVNLAHDGSVEQINVVNAFDTRSGETIVDYGTYAMVKNLSGTSEIQIDGEKLSLTGDTDTVYYQGKLDQTTLPWDIGIQYFIDGKECTADEAAGQSGMFALHIDVKQGAEKYSEFFETYLLQISLSLDKNLCSNIQTNQGSINVVGHTANISLIHAMNAEATYVITADVKNFELSAIQIQGISLAGLGLDASALVDGGGFSGLDEALAGLTTATAQLSESAAQLADGSNQFYGGIELMDTKAGTLSDGLNELSAQTGQLNEGAAVYGQAITDLSQSLTTAAGASKLIHEAIDAMNTQAASLPAQSEQLLDHARQMAIGDDPNIAAIAQAYLMQNQVIAQLTTGIAALNTGYTQFNDGLQSGSDTTALTEGYAQIQEGIGAVYTAIQTINTAVDEQVLSGVKDLMDSYSLLNEGNQKIAEALAAFDEQAQAMPDQIASLTTEMTENLLPTNIDNLSFVSDQCATSGVLFILQTEPIAVPVIAGNASPESKEPETLAERFFNLFGLWNPQD